VLQELLKHKHLDIDIDLYQYIFNNIKNIDYVKYREKGYFIGSGAIESGNKIVLQDRLKRTGQRWNISSAQTLLTLRAKYESRLWDEEVVRFIMDKYY
jgi:hypothetical protein